MAATKGNGIGKDEKLLNGFLHPDLPEPAFIMMTIQANGY
jgi:hypothetical protein